MAQTTKKTKRARPGPSLEERTLRVERHMLATSLRHQRKIRQLSIQLRRATRAADESLRDVARMVLDRDVPPGERRPSFNEGYDVLNDRSRAATVLHRQRCGARGDMAQPRIDALAQ